MNGGLSPKQHFLICSLIPNIYAHGNNRNPPFCLEHQGAGIQQACQDAPSTPLRDESILSARTEGTKDYTVLLLSMDCIGDGQSGSGCRPSLVMSNFDIFTLTTLPYYCCCRMVLWYLNAAWMPPSLATCYRNLYESLMMYQTAGICSYCVWHLFCLSTGHQSWRRPCLLHYCAHQSRRCKGFHAVVGRHLIVLPHVHS